SGDAGSREADLPGSVAGELGPEKDGERWPPIEGLAEPARKDRQIGQALDVESRQIQAKRDGQPDSFDLDRVGVPSSGEVTCRLEYEGERSDKQDAPQHAAERRAFHG